jgi:3-hydroxybutyryl-CoA dehydratase
MKGIPFAELKIGDKGSMTKTVTMGDIYSFAGVSGDFNPFHLDEEYAKGTMFKERIAHGMLSASLISAVMGTIMPGPMNLYMSQELFFKAPVKIGDTVTATCEIIEKIEAKHRLILRTTVTNQDGVLVIDGTAKLYKED